MENQKPNFKKHSRIGSMISSIGLVVMLLSVILFIVLDRNKEQEITTLKSNETQTAKQLDSLRFLNQMKFKEQSYLESLEVLKMVIQIEL